MKHTKCFRHSFFLPPLLGLVFVTYGVRAQNSVEGAIKQLSSANAPGYLQPLVNSIGANLNSGAYHSASISDMGLTIRLDIIGMGTFIGDAEKTYNAVAPQPFDPTPIQTATLFGGLGSVANGPGGTQYSFQSGEWKTSIVPFAAPQLTIGNFYGTQAIIRYIPIPEVSNFPKMTYWGLGARHSISRYLPTAPVDLAASILYQKVSIGDILEETALSFGAQVSKSYAVLTLYGGLQYESSSMNVNYVQTGSGSSVKLDLDGENKFRATAGLGLNLAILNLFADISVGKVTVASGGIGFGF